MDLKEILLKNKMFNSWKQDIDEQIKTKKENIKEINDTILEKDFKEMTYNEAKDFYDVIKYNLTYKEKVEEVGKWLQELKTKEYPILNKAHYYPIINEIDFLTDKQKHELDKALYDFKSGYIMIGSSRWHKVNLDKEVENKVFEFLYDKKIVEKFYHILCPNEYSEHCQSICKTISEEKYDINKKYYSFRGKKITDEENKWCEEQFEKGNIIYELSCMDCDSYLEVDSWDDIQSNVIGITYKIVIAPDMTFANK